MPGPQQITQEDLKNMTPEQIAELQKQNCIFCHIISGKVASKKIYEDDKCLAILDINPANPGHVVLMPKEHYAIMPLIPEDVIGHLFKIAKGISHACLRAFKAQGTNIFVANGVAAGQKAQHFMLHVIPRKEGDDLKSFALPKKEISEEDLEEVKKKLKARMNSIFGIKEKEPIIMGKKEETKAKPEIKNEEIEAEVTEEEKKEPKKEEDDDRKEEKKSSEINLDDIANLLGAGK